MNKSVVVHTRVSPNVKNECDIIFEKLGITASYAISLFLNQVALKKSIPLELTAEEKEDLTEFAININLVDGVAPSEKARKIIKLFEEGILDSETTQIALKRLYQ